MTHKRVSFQIDPSVYAAARLAARRADVNVGEVVEQALRRHEGVRLVLGAMALIERTAPTQQPGGSESPVRQQGDQNSPTQQHEGGSESPLDALLG